MKAPRLTLAVLFLNACAMAPQAPSDSEPEPEPAPQLTAAMPEVAAPAPPAPPARVSVPPMFEAERQEIKDRLRNLPSIDRTAPVDDLWQRIRFGFGLPDLDSALVREKTRYYAARLRSAEAGNPRAAPPRAHRPHRAGGRRLAAHPPRLRHGRPP